MGATTTTRRPLGAAPGDCGIGSDYSGITSLQFPMRRFPEKTWFNSPFAIILEWNPLPLAMQKLSIRATKLHPDAQLPRSAHGPQEDAGFDLMAVEEVTLPAGRWASVATGLAIEIPPGYEGQVRPRSGLARKFGVTLLNTPGTIDPGYRGEIQVLMINHGQHDYTVKPGDRIAQLIIGAYADVQWELEEQLAASTRGSGGFGSTGA